MSDKSGETSSSRHRMPHPYASQSDDFAGWMGVADTAQSIGQPEILAQAEVGKPAIKQAEAPKSRAKTTGKPSTRER
jgi:predicted hotdog family 3-hydroxylacyl-ACP dehydratase